MTTKPRDWVCTACGSNHVWRDAWAEWDPDRQRWSLVDVYDAAWCVDCDQETTTKPIEYIPEPDEEEDENDE